MAGVPAYCARCKLAFVSNAIDVSNSINIRFVGNTTNCPRCGNTARFIEGSFSVRNEQISMNSGPLWSHQVVEALRSAAVKAAQSKDAEEFISNVRAISPELATALTPVSQNKPLWIVLLAFLYLLTRININFNIDVDLNPLIHEAIAVAERNADPESSVKSQIELKASVEAKRSWESKVKNKGPTKRQRLRAKRNPKTR